MQSRNEQVTAAAHALRKRAVEIRAASTPAPPKLVYHYTNAAGLLGIASSRKLWAGHFHHMNDGEELALGQVAGRDLVSEHFWDWPDERIRSVVGLVGAVIEHRKEARVFVASFSSEPDSLPQWRTYAAEGTGFALGFTLASDGWPVAEDADFEVVQCLYSIAQAREKLDGQLRELREALEEAVEGLHGVERAEMGELFTVARSEIVDTWGTMASAIKHDAFRDEKEWRLVGTTLPAAAEPTKYRISRFGITPYVELEFAGHALQEIRLGPRARSPEVEHGIRHLIGGKKGLGPLEIKPSRVPFK